MSTDPRYMDLTFRIKHRVYVCGPLYVVLKKEVPPVQCSYLVVK